MRQNPYPLQSEAEWTVPSDWCKKPERWSAPDKWASEDEVSVFLGNLVRLLHPDRVLETGSYLGHTSYRIGEALQEQGYGTLDTVEKDEDRANWVALVTRFLPVTVHVRDSLSFKGGPYDLVFLDSEFLTREEELERFRNPGAVWVMHDGYHPHVRKVCEANQGVFIPTPRGLFMGRY